MTRAVHEVHALAPHCRAGYGVELRARSRTGEAEVLKGEMTFQHESVDAALKVSNRTELNGTRYVRCAVLILRSAVEEEESLRAQLHVALRRRLIMHYGAVRLISCYGVKRDVAEKRLLTTQILQLAADRKFCLATCRNRLLQPLEEAHHCHAVTLHGMTESIALRLVLHSLHGRNGRRGEDGIEVAACLGKRAVHRSGVDEERVCVIAVEPLDDVVIIVHHHTLLSEIRHHLHGQLVVLDVEHRRLLSDDEPSHKHGSAMHVGATEVKSPGDVVKLCEEHAGRALAEQFVTDA